MLGLFRTRHGKGLHGGSPPGPRGWPLLGVLPSVVRDPLGFFLDVARRFGRIASMSLAGERLYFLNDPDLVQHVLQDNHANYWKGRGMDVAKPLLGDGLASSEGALWEEQHRRLEPAFLRGSVVAMIPDMVPVIRKAVESWRGTAEAGGATEIAHAFGELALRVILRTLFGTSHDDRTSKLVQATSAVSRTIHRRMWFPFLRPELWPTPGNFRFRRALRTLEGAVEEVVAARHRSAQDPADLLSFILRATNGTPAGPRRIRDDVMTFLYTGHETTGVALAWTLHLLLLHEPVLETVTEEILGLGNSEAIEDLLRLPALDRAVRESLRLRPPGWLFVRTPHTDDVLGGFPVPKDATVLVSPFTLHHHPAHWKDPEVFDPDRFLPNEEASRHRFAYIPFGGGPRRCIGKTLALVILKVAVAEILRGTRPRLLDKTPVPPRADTTLKPSRAILVRFEPRA